MNRNFAYYLLWLLIAPVTVTVAMHWIASVAPGVPLVVALNVLVLLAAGFISVRLLPGSRTVKLTLLLAVPIVQYFHYWGESEPGFEQFNVLIIGIETLVILVGGFAAGRRSRDPRLGDGL